MELNVIIFKTHTNFDPPDTQGKVKLVKSEVNVLSYWVIGQVLHAHRNNERMIRRYLCRLHRKNNSTNVQSFTTTTLKQRFSELVANIRAIYSRYKHVRI